MEEEKKEISKEELLWQTIEKTAYEKGLLDGRQEIGMFAIIPVSILENKNLSANAKLLYGEIMALSKKSGKCYATNEYISEMLGLKKGSIRGLLKELSGIGLIMVNIKRNKKGTYRDIVVSYFIGGVHYSKQGGCYKDNGGGAIDKAVKRDIDKVDINKIDNPKGLVKLPSYGNEDINKVINLLKEKLGGSLDGSDKVNRQYAFLLIGRMKKDYPGKDPTDLIAKIIEFGLADEFHQKNITSFKYLFYNTGKIIQGLKSKITNPKVITI